MIHVLLADDQALVRAGFRALLRPQPDICRWWARPRTGRPRSDWPGRPVLAYESGLVRPGWSA